MIYRREIDGLRAVAVIPVVLFHAGLKPVSGGYIGVDVFFVISGYLITSILISEFEQGNFSLAKFYERRARRILPALFFVTLCCLPFAWIWMLPKEFKDFSQSVVAVVVFASNILFWSEEGYFAPAAELKPLLHTWSLAVEEQYYLFFPIFLMVAWRFGRNRVFWTICMIAVLSFAASEWGWRNKPSANFFLAPTRVWELLAGSMCAFWLSGRKQPANNLLSITGLLLIGFAIFYYDGATPFPSFYTLVPVVGTILIIVFSGPDTWTAKLLGLRYIVGIGLISYSVYLWHQPLFAFARIRSDLEPSPYLMAMLAGLSLVLGYLSWRYVEKPFRKGDGSILPTRRAVFVASSAAALVFVTGGLLGQFSEETRGLPVGVHPSELALARFEEGYCFYSVGDNESLLIGAAGLNCRLSYGRKADLMLFGDSLAGHWEPFFKEFGERMDVAVHSITTNWCHPSFLNDFKGPQVNRSRQQCIINREYLKNNITSYDAIIIAGDWSSAEFYSVDNAMEYILKSGTKIIVMPTPVILERRSVERFQYGKSHLLIKDNEKNYNGQEFWRQLRQKYSQNLNVRIYEQPELFFDNFGSEGQLDLESFPYSLDGLHISVHGSKMSFKQYSAEGRDSDLLEWLLR